MAVLGAVGFVVVGVILWFVDPSARPIALVGGLFFGGGAFVLLLVRHASPGTQTFTRAMGAASGC
ncbi:hypothetical protein [Ornithinimicrobium cavernae]|uniref:hypothetical protein n=1 Tax=Ornithinimicrobium cavernae TaxID=2666047 RepID=UPI0012B17EEE|nr:hypothetical protein [Ornithinimicrobium cavernae]